MFFGKMSKERQGSGGKKDNGHSKTYNIVTVSIWERFVVYLLALFVGLWVLTKRFCRWAWNPGAFYKLELRDVPPQCLVDTALGQHKYVKLKSGIKLHYVESGSRTQPLLLLLHGFPDCWLGFRYQIPVLSEHFRVVALDLKGFGDSDKPVWHGGYRIETIIEELEQFVHALGVTRCSVIGHDLGALIGWFWAHCDQGVTVEKFIAISAAHPNVHWSGGVPLGSSYDKKWLAFVQLPFLPEAEALSSDISLINERYKHLQVGPGNDELIEAYKYTFSRREDWIGPFNYFRCIPFRRVRDTTPVCAVTTLLVTGNRDPHLRMENVIKSTEYCDRFNVKIVEGAGHFPHQEQPDMFNKYMLKFFRIRRTGYGFDQGEAGQEAKSTSKGIMNRMMGAVSNTVKYGNSVIDSVQKRTSNGTVLLSRSLPAIGLNAANTNAEA